MSARDAIKFYQIINEDVAIQKRMSEGKAGKGDREELVKIAQNIGLEHELKFSASEFFAAGKILRRMRKASDFQINEQLLEGIAEGFSWSCGKHTACPTCGFNDNKIHIPNPRIIEEQVSRLADKIKVVHEQRMKLL